MIECSNYEVQRGEVTASVVSFIGQEEWDRRAGEDDRQGSMHGGRKNRRANKKAFQCWEKEDTAAT